MTSVPGPTFGVNGFVSPPDSAILAGVQTDINQAFGGNLNPALNTPQGQLASSQTASISNADATFQYYTTQTDPAFAQGRMQDAIGRIYFLERNPSEPTVLQIVCNGAAQGVIIPVNALIKDTSNNTYNCTQAGTIPVSGSITLTFANLVPGPIAIPQTSQISIFQAIPGWDSVSVVSGVVGVNVETRAQFEARRQLSVALNSIGSLPSVLGSVLSVPGVLDAFVTENDNNANQTIGGFTLVPNSLYVAATGGTAAGVAKAIWSKKAPGCNYNGSTTVVVQDTNSGYSPPFPSYNVSFQIPFPLATLFSINIKNNPQVPANALTLIQNSLLSAFAGNDGGPRARIGSTLYASRYMASVTSLGSWAQLISLQIGSNNTPAAVITGSISGTTLTVSAITSGSVTAGQTLSGGSGVSGSGAAAGSGIVVGTQIVAQLSGTSGSTGTYSLTGGSQAVGSGVITLSLANQNLVSVQINQEPTLNANNIILTLT